MISALVGLIVPLPGTTTPLGPNTTVVPATMTVVGVAPLPMLNVDPLMIASV